MKDYKEAIESIMKDTTSKVMDHAIKAYRQGYENGLGKAQTDSYVKGYEDGKADTPFTDTEEAEKKAYNRGLNDMWEVIKKVIENEDKGGYSIKMLRKLFGSYDVYNITRNYTPEEALAKIKEYEDKQKQDVEIKVGYEVYNLDPENKRIVTAIDENKAIQLCSNGKYTVDNIDTLHWTGREDLRIKKVLENITNEV